ncbi:hypothetical protein [Rathayibacter tritici]|uniref:Lipoprotein n=1 Tax=Rathayibacter tritici TaxID=33888 RepID=A0A169C3C5_9MICO|nr:hypothetical protein [Rathayibacter tritici]AND17301.1 hypothetical protein A6122_2178 [Rathayibacter tritici]
MKKIQLVVITSIFAGFALAGCSRIVEEVGPKANIPVASSGKFSGPYSDLFDAALADAQSEVEKLALEDEVISDQEYAYFQGEITSCLAELGLSASFAADGRLNYANPDDVSQDKIQACSAKNGITILAIRDAMERNPTRLDEAQIMVDCLKQVQIVDKTYTAADYANGVDLDRMVDTDEFKGCSDDPLNYASTGTNEQR